MDQWFLTFSDHELHTYALGGSSPFWFLRGDDGFSTSSAFLFNSCDESEYPSLQRRKAISAKSQDITKLMAYDFGHPFSRDLVVLEFGSNVPGAPIVYKDQSRDIALAIRRTSPDSICFWVSAPRMLKISDERMREVNEYINQGLTEASEILKREFPQNKNPSCYFINSQKYSAYPTDFPVKLDGVHYPFPWFCSPEERSRNMPKCIDHTIPWVNGVKNEITSILELI